MKKNKPTRRDKFKALFDAFGIKRKDRETLRNKYNEQNLKAKDIYQKLANKTGEKPGGGFLNFATSKGRSKLFTKAEKKYEKKFGTPGQDKLEEIKTKGEEAAQEYYAPEQQQQQESIAEQQKRLGEDYQTSIEDLARQYGYTTEDINRYRERAARDYQQRLADTALQTQLEKEGLTANLNAAGQFDSSLYGKRFGEQQQQQASRLGGINTGYTDYVQGLETDAQRAQNAYNQNLAQYQRNRDRGVYDIDQLDQEQQRNLERAQQGYATDYFGNILSNVKQKSDTYYNRQAQNDNQAAGFTQDLYNVT